MPPDPVVRRLRGAEMTPYIQRLAQLRITVFREYPYLYEGTLAYEEKYLATYLNCPASTLVLVLVGDEVVGASTALPLRAETPELQAPFLAHGLAVADYFYFGESVLRRDYRGRGLGVRFFAEREAAAREYGRCAWTTFCAVERAPDDPRRPAGYQPLDNFWTHRGYQRRPELRGSIAWQEIGEAAETPKPMVFWTKKLGPG